MVGRAWLVWTVVMRPVCVSQRLRQPSVSPMMTRWPQAAIAVATPSVALDIMPHDGRLGFVSVTCAPQPAPLSHTCPGICATALTPGADELRRNASVYFTSASACATYSLLGLTLHLCA
jgi:hypothetical protein